MRRLLYICSFIFFLSACSEYQKVLKSNDFNLKLEKAKNYYQEEDYNRAIPLLDELSTVLMGTSKAEEVSYYYAFCHYAIGDNLMSAHLFKQYVKSFPKGKHHEECSFMLAKCYYNEAPIYSLDPSNTKKAIKELQIFIDRYPNSSRVSECNLLLDELRSKLARKEFEIAKQYYITENYKSAIIAFNRVLTNFPDIANREEIYFLILETSYSLAIRSISSKKEERLKDTLDAYEMFVDNYQNSKFIKGANKIHNRTLESLKKLK